MTDLRDTVVIVLHFGPREVTERALETLRRVYPDSHAPRIILVENGSSLSGNRFPDIQRISLPENTGYGEGNNHGLRAALMTGARFIILLNNDVRMTPGVFESMRRATDQPRIGLVGVPIQESEGYVWGGGTVSWWLLRTHLARRSGNVSRLQYIHGACLGVTRECLERIGLLREDLFLYWEDVDFGLRARRAGFSFAVADVPPLLHGTPTERTHTAMSLKTYYLVRNAVAVARLWGGPLLRVWIRVLLPVRWVVARLRGKQIVANALTDALRLVRGAIPHHFA